MADAIDEGLIKALVEAVRAFLREGTRVAQRSDEFLTVVIERKDKSDPHWKLCEALEAYDAAELRKARALSRHKAPLSVECKHRPSEFDMLGTCMDCGATLPLSAAGDDVERLIEARKVVAKEYRRLGLNPNPVLRGDFDAGVEVQAALRSQYNKVSKPL